MSLRVAVLYALPQEQCVVELEMNEGATVEDAIKASALIARFPEIATNKCAVGVWGRVTTLTAALRDGDRVEIYRPLVVDPKEARRRREQRRTIKQQSTPR